MYISQSKTWTLSADLSEGWDRGSHCYSPAMISLFPTSPIVHIFENGCLYNMLS